MSQQINLFNPIFLAQKKVFSARTLAIGLSIILAALAVMHTTQHVQLAMLKRQLDESNAQFEQAKRQLAEFTAAGQRAPSKLLEDEAARLDERLKSQERLLESFASGSLGNTDGFARYMTALSRQALPGVWITAFSIDGSDGVRLLRGRLQQSDLLPAYLRKLNREDVFRGQAFTELQMHAVTESVGGTLRQVGARRAIETSSEPHQVRSIEFILGPTGASKRGGR